MRPRPIPLLTLLTTILFLSGCIGDPAPTPAGPAEGRPLARTGTAPVASENVREPFIIEWADRLDAEACVVGATVDTCDGVPSTARGAEVNPNSRHFVRHAVALTDIPQALTVTMEWKEDGATGSARKDANPLPTEAAFEFRISCSTADREPCVGGRHTIAHAAGHEQTLVLEDVDLSWYDLEDHRLTWTFGIQSNEQAGLYFFPETHVRFAVEGIFEVDDS